MEKGEKDKGFVKEMRTVAMKLHTREQAPKEGQQQDAPKPKAWEPKREGYLRFLAESKAVYDVLETVVQDLSHPEYARFTKTGLERSKALVEDIKWFEETYTLQAPPVQPDGPGATYAAKIAELAKSDPPAFICHFYNFYFAHTAGGRMIGSKISEMLLDKKELQFYKYDGDMNASLDAVRKSINEISEQWTEDQKAHCLEETAASFKFSGKIMECISACYFFSTHCGLDMKHESDG